MNSSLQWNFFSLVFFILLILFFVYQIFYYFFPLRGSVQRKIENKIVFLRSISFLLFLLLFILIVINFQIKGRTYTNKEIGVQILVDDSLSMENNFQNLKEDLILLKKKLSFLVEANLKLFSGNDTETFLNTKSEAKANFAFSKYFSNTEVNTEKNYSKLFKIILSDCLYNLPLQNKKIQTNKTDIFQKLILCYPQNENKENIALTYLQETDQFFAGFSSKIEIELVSTYSGAAQITLNFKDNKHSSISKNIFLKKGQNKVKVALVFSKAGTYLAKINIAAFPKIKESRQRDNFLVYSFDVSPGKRKLILASSIPGYDFSLWKQVGLSSGAFVMEKRIVLLKKDPLSFAKSKNDILLVHNIALAQWKPALKQAAFFVFGPDTKLSFKKTFPNISLYSGFNSLADDSLELSSAGKNSGFIPASIQEESIALKNLIAINENKNIEVLIRTKKYKLPVFIRLKKTDQLLLLSDSLYKNYFIGLGLKNTKTSIKNFYGSVLEYISREKNSKHWKSYTSYMTLAKPALFQIPESYGKRKYTFKNANYFFTSIKKNQEFSKKESLNESFKDESIFTQIKIFSCSLSLCYLPYYSSYAGARTVSIEKVVPGAKKEINFYMNYSKKELESFYNFANNAKNLQREDVILLSKNNSNNSITKEFTENNFISKSVLNRINQKFKDFKHYIKKHPELESKDYVISFRENPVVLVITFILLFFFWYATLFPSHLFQFFSKNELV